MIRILKIGYAGLNTPNIEAALAYYTAILGLTLMEREANGTAYLRSTIDHHTIVLYPAAEVGLRHVAFQIGGDRSLAEAAAELRQAGLRVEVQTDAQPGIAQLLQLHDPEGTTIQLYASTQTINQGSREPGIVPEKLGHVALRVHNPQKMADFYQQVLGFRVSDWIEDFFVFLRCGPDHHTMNFLRAPGAPSMHHIAFQLHDWAHVQRACDLLGQHGIPLLWGPGRHGAGHNIYTYHYDPDHNIVELFTELDIMLDEELGYFEPRPWHEDFPQRPKVWKDSPRAVNIWGIMPPREIMGPPDGGAQ